MFRKNIIYTIFLFKNRIKPLIINLTSLLFFIMYNNFLSFGQTFPTLYYERKIFIDIDYKFNNEFLYKPYQIREITNTKEKVILDIGNVCLYVFSDNGKFIRKISRAGQGPGDILNPSYFDVDINGDIYVYEQGNYRISIFSKYGKFINSFRLESVPSFIPTLYVTKDREIVVNLPSSGYFITIFSREGKILREIGNTPYFDSPLYYEKLTGYPFKCENGNYYIFLETQFLVKVFDKSGSIILEKNLDEILPFLSKIKELDKIKSRNIGFLKIFWDILYRNNKFYILTSEERGINVSVYVLNKDLAIEKKIVLTLENELMIKLENGKLVNNPFNIKYTCEFLQNEDILFPSKDGSNVYIFRKINK